jgi:2-polyprenyl-3-methyl-5-hydroxy-6-metoxy-1,4-benzoquinol methylase
VTTTARIAYLASSTWKGLCRRGVACPSCGSRQSSLSARKHVLTALRRCGSCDLLFRTPTSDARESARFYQHAYAQGFTTLMPTPAELAELMRAGFRGTEKDYSSNIDVLHALGCRAGARLFDYGCSWGYGSWQLMRAGYDVCAFEISVPRADYARASLGVDVHSTLDAVRGPFDVFFSSHVLEHVPSVSDAIRLAKRVLRPGGWFVALTPNGSDAYRAVSRESWMKSWGLVHPNLLDDRFYARAFEDVPLLLASTPHDLPAIARWAADPRTSVVLDLRGAELLSIARIG